MKNIVILGSTGSIGQNSLEIIKHFPGKFRAVGLSTNSRIDILWRQIKIFHPEFVCVCDRKAGLALKSKLKSEKIKLFLGKDSLQEMACQKGIDQLVMAISGAAALPVLLKAIDSRKDIALANKEALVMAGPLIMGRVRRKKIRLVPIDSEQSAIWQCLEGRNKDKLKNIYLTASGGPFLKAPKGKLKNVSLSAVLGHPRWKMGKKISVDSATLMNKGLEVLEAMYLFGVSADKIKVLIHPQAIVHSMVEFIDGVVLAQLSATDMRIPIQYALTYPERLKSEICGIDFYRLKRLSFEKPDFRKFPCLELAYEAAVSGGTAPCVLNAANEVSVDEFLKRKIDFLSIPKIIRRVLKKHRNLQRPALGDILQADKWARDEAYNFIGGAS